MSVGSPGDYGMVGDMEDMDGMMYDQQDMDGMEYGGESDDMVRFTFYLSQFAYLLFWPFTEWR